MLQLSLLAATLLIGSNALAAPVLTLKSGRVRAPTVMRTAELNPNGQPPFHVLKEHYRQGQVPTSTHLTGWHSGRCYMHDDMHTPLPMLLMGEEKESANGPLFPGRKLKFVLGGVSDGTGRATTPPDRYDVLSDYDRTQLESGLESLLNEVNDADLRSQSVVSTNKVGNVEYRARIHGGYIVVDTTLIEASEPLRAGETYAMCYFFKKVHE